MRIEEDTKTVMEGGLRTRNLCPPRPSWRGWFGVTVCSGSRPLRTI